MVLRTKFFVIVHIEFLLYARYWIIITLLYIFIYKMLGLENVMDCKETQRMITGFLNDELEIRSLERFLNHIEECKSCREELTIQFLVEVGTKRLEDGTNFNLSEELDRMMKDAWQRLRTRKRLHKTAFFLQVLVVIEFVVTVVLTFIL